MKIDDTLLRAPARRGARLVAFDLLRKVRKTRERLDDVSDAQALHDFRVALRRLRSWLRASRGCLRDTLSKQDEQRLKSIAEATGASRDLEVHIEWVHASMKSLRGKARKGADWLLAELRSEKAECDRYLRDVLEREYEGAVDRVLTAIDHYDTPVHVEEPRLAAVMVDLVQEHGRALHACLARVNDIGDETEAHESRIAGKRLRYLIEPLSEVVPEIGAVVEELKELQDTLGDVHDAHVFGNQLAAMIAGAASGSAVALGSGADTVSVPEDAHPGLSALSRRLTRRGKNAFSHARDRWFADDGARLLAQVAHVASKLESIGTRGREIERKYLLKRMPADLPPASASDIRQGYLPGEELVERLRTETSGRKVRYYRTVKFGSDVERTELEEETDARLFRALWPFTRGRRIHKRRHRIEDDGRVWELDEFLDRKLVIAEVQVADADDSPAIPAWLEGALVRDVTEEEAYSNHRLAR